jgi:hypothetical protein
MVIRMSKAQPIAQPEAPKNTAGAAQTHQRRAPMLR